MGWARVQSPYWATSGTSATDKMHDFNPVLVCNRQLGPFGPRRNLPIQLDRNPVRPKLQPLQNRGQGRR